MGTLDYFQHIINTAFDNSTNAASSISMIISLILFFIGLFITLRGIKQWYGQQYIADLGKRITLLEFAFLTSIVLSFIEQLQTWEMPLIFGVRLTYPVYALMALLYITGISLLINKSARIPDSRKKSFTHAQLLMILPILGLLGFIIAFSSLFQYHSFSDFIIDVFAIISIQWIRRAIRNEIDRNSSTIAKLRLSIINTAILASQIYMLSLLSDAAIRLYGEMTGVDTYFFVVISKIPQPIAMFIGVVYLSWALKIPKRLRIEHKLEPARFNKFKKHT